MARSVPSSSSVMAIAAAVVAAACFVTPYACAGTWQAKRPVAKGCGDTRSDLEKRRIALRILRQPLPMVLDLVAEQAGVRVIMEDGVAGEMADLTLDGTLPTVLDAITATTGTVWWAEGSTLRVADSRSVVTRQVGFPVPAALEEAAATACLPTAILSFQPVPAAGMVSVTGPKLLVTQVEDLAKTLAKPLGEVRVTKYGQPTVQSLSRR